MDQSHWLPLGDETIRDKFAVALCAARPGGSEPARDRPAVAHVSAGPVHAGEAQRLAALDALAQKDYLKAAEGHEKAMLRCLRTYINFVQTRLLHRCAGACASAAGAGPAGRRQARRSASGDRHGAVDAAGRRRLAILVVPGLEKRGQEKDAKDIFEKTLAVYEKLCKEYPNCPWAHNSAAWLSVCCGRNLEAAKGHALKATELAPTNAGHLDTLAEVYFQLGDKDKAIAMQKKAIELDPKQAYFKKQLKRIEAGDPKAERPPENDDAN